MLYRRVAVYFPTGYRQCGAKDVILPDFLFPPSRSLGDIGQWAVESSLCLPMKYVVDTCILNKLVDGVLAPDQLPTDGEFVASHIQIDELNRTKDEEKRAQLFLMFATTVEEVVPTETFVIGVSRIGHGKLSDGDLFERLRNELNQLNGEKRNNTMDALIAEIAINNGYTLLTADYHLHKVAKNNGCNVLYWQQT